MNCSPYLLNMILLRSKWVLLCCGRSAKSERFLCGRIYLGDCAAFANLISTVRIFFVFLGKCASLSRVPCRRRTDPRVQNHNQHNDDAGQTSKQWTDTKKTGGADINKQNSRTSLHEKSIPQKYIKRQLCTIRTKKSSSRISSQPISFITILFREREKEREEQKERERAIELVFYNFVSRGWTSKS